MKFSTTIEVNIYLSTLNFTLIKNDLLKVKVLYCYMHPGMVVIVFEFSRVYFRAVLVHHRALRAL